MKIGVDALKEQHMWDDFIVMIGGAPLNEEFSEAVSADAYCADVATAVEVAKKADGRVASFLSTGSLSFGVGR